MRRIAAAALVLLLVGAGAAAGATPKPTARDRSQARALAYAADDFLTAIDAAEQSALRSVKADYATCSANYDVKVDSTRLADLESFLAQASSTARIPTLWRSMVARWDALHVRNATLRLVIGIAHGQAVQVRKLGQAPEQDSICDVLSGWEASGWESTYVTDLESAWTDSIPVDGNSIEAARARVQKMVPQLHALGLGDAQISSVLIAVL